MADKLYTKALKKAESAAGLARALHVSASTVRRWKKKVPEARKEALTKFLKREAESAKRQTDDRNKFLELMKLAGSIDKLPDIRTHEKVRAGRMTSGIDYTRRFSEMLSLSIIDRIEVWVKKLKRRFPDWQLVAVVSEYGKGEHKGYRTVYHQLAPEAGDFAISSEVATPRVNRVSEAMDLLREKLEAMAEDASVLVFVHAVTAFNYRRRTAEESSAWETMQRRKRQPKVRKEKKVKVWEPIITEMELENSSEPSKPVRKRTKKKPSKVSAKKSAKRSTTQSKKVRSAGTASGSSKSSGHSKKTSKTSPQKRHVKRHVKRSSKKRTKATSAVVSSKRKSGKASTRSSTPKSKSTRKKSPMLSPKSKAPTTTRSSQSSRSSSPKGASTAGKRARASRQKASKHSTATSQRSSKTSLKRTKKATVSRRQISTSKKSKKVTQRQRTLSIPKSTTKKPSSNRGKKTRVKTSRR